MDLVDRLLAAHKADGDSSAPSSTPYGLLKEAADRIANHQAELRTCGSCKFWAEGSWSSDGFGKCSLAEGEYDDKGMKRDPPMFVTAMYGYEAELQTTKDFGCTEHKSK